MSVQDQSRCTLGAGAIVVVHQSVVLVKVGYGAAKGQWILPGGLLHQREHPAAAATRETLEETGLTIQVTRQVSVRHRIRKDGSSDVYWVFLATLASPPSDGTFPPLKWPPGEIEEARFWTPAAISAAPEVRPYTKLIIERALENPDKSHVRLPVTQVHDNHDEAFGIG